MKKFIIAASLIFLGLGSAFAQQGKQAVGGSLSYGTETESMGIGAKYQYNITNEIRIEPSMDYFFKHNGLSMFDINANVHYLVPIASNVKIYPLAGFTFTSWHQDLGIGAGFGASTSKFGVNLGAGMEFALDRNWNMNFEMKYQLISDLDQAVFNLGVAYSF